MPIRFRESKISAHHNYLVNDMLTPGFVIGDPGSEKGFYFLADFVLPGESTARISARLLAENGDLLTELKWSRLGKNPSGCLFQSLSSGFKVLAPSSGEPILEVRTEQYANGYLTRIRGRFFDENGRLRVEPHGDSIRIHGRVK